MSLPSGFKNAEILKFLSITSTTMKVTLETTQGSITFDLFADVAPKTCENFTTHCKNGYYNGVIFHRII